MSAGWEAGSRKFRPEVLQVPAMKQMAVPTECGGSLQAGEFQGNLKQGLNYLDFRGKSG